MKLRNQAAKSLLDAGWDIEDIYKVLTLENRVLATGWKYLFDSSLKPRSIKDTEREFSRETSSLSE
jgi:hypothetical protein